MPHAESCRSQLPRGEKLRRLRSSRVLGHLQGNFREARNGRDESERQERIDDAVTQSVLYQPSVQRRKKTNYRRVTFC